LSHGPSSKTKERIKINPVGWKMGGNGGGKDGRGVERGRRGGGGVKRSVKGGKERQNTGRDQTMATKRGDRSSKRD